MPINYDKLPYLRYDQKPDKKSLWRKICRCQTFVNIWAFVSFLVAAFVAFVLLTNNHGTKPLQDLLITSVEEASVPKATEALKAKWEAFCLRHNKTYVSKDDEAAAKDTFFHNDWFVQMHNLKYEKGIESFRIDINEFADLDAKTFKSIYNGYQRKARPLKFKYERFTSVKQPSELPDKVDWREEGYVTPVKNQKQCGSCWSFSATGSLEGQLFKKNKILTSLSEQNLIDCSRRDGNNGCSGGQMDDAFEYIYENKGIDTEAEYPYEGRNGRCRYRKDGLNLADVGFVDLESGDENALQEAVAMNGPISVAIDASSPLFQMYKSGVYYNRHCSSDQLDHGVLVVGYGTDPKGGDYWLVKNSWGSDWGDNGYIKMARNRDNHCGIATQASFPKV